MYPLILADDPASLRTRRLASGCRVTRVRRPHSPVQPSTVSNIIVPHDHTSDCVVKQSGHAILYVTPKSGGAVESYLVTLRKLQPSSLVRPHADKSAKLRIEGIVWGSPYIELVETNAIQSSTGFTAQVRRFIPYPMPADSQIDYKGRGWVSGKAHTFKAVLTKTDSKKSLQTYEGQWTGTSHIGGSKGPIFLDTSSGAKEEVTVAALDAQGPWESRRLWDKVAKGIKGANYDLAGAEKSRIEVSLTAPSILVDNTDTPE